MKLQLLVWLGIACILTLLWFAELRRHLNLYVASGLLLFWLAAIYYVVNLN